MLTYLDRESGKRPYKLLRLACVLRVFLHVLCMFLAWLDLGFFVRNPDSEACFLRVFLHVLCMFLAWLDLGFFLSETRILMRVFCMFFCMFFACFWHGWT